MELNIYIIVVLLILLTFLLIIRYINHSDFFTFDSKLYYTDIDSYEYNNDDFNIKVINLKRRPDRLKNIVKQLNNEKLKYDIFYAVDGKQLKFNDNIKTLFKDNNFEYKRGIIGCALSHLYLWMDLINSNENYYIIIEDDATLCTQFKIKLHALKNEFSKKDIMFLGYLKYFVNKRKYYDTYYVDKSSINIRMLRKDLFIGGTHCYSITKDAARKLVNYINEYGIDSPIDNFMHSKPHGNVLYETVPHLADAKWLDGDQKTIDTDIQFINDHFDNL